MNDNRNNRQSPFGLLPEPEFQLTSFVTAAAINLMIVGVLLLIGMTAKQVVQRHNEQFELIASTAPPKNLPKLKPIDIPEPPPPPVQPKVAFDMPKIEMPKPEPKPIEMDAKVDMSVVRAKGQQVALAPQLKAALTAAMPAQAPDVKASMAAVDLGETFGVTPNPNTSKPARVAAIGNIYGNRQGAAIAPHGVTVSTGIGNGTAAGSNAGSIDKVAWAGISAGTTATQTIYGKVTPAGIPVATALQPKRPVEEQVEDTKAHMISHPIPHYTSEARQLKIEGDVVLTVTFLANGQVQGVVRGLGHGLDNEARRVAEQIRFRPATHNGHPVDSTAKITIKFQLA